MRVYLLVLLALLHKLCFSFTSRRIVATLRPHHAAITQTQTPTKEDDLSTTIQKHIQNAKEAKCNNEVSTQQIEMNYAEQTLLQYIDECKLEISDCIPPPDAQILSDVIDGLLLLSPSSSLLLVNNNNANDKTFNMNVDYDYKLQELSEQQKYFFGVSSSNKRNKPQQRNDPHKSDRATQILDIMESYHEPKGALYDKLIASHGEAALQYLSCLSREKSREQSCEDDDELSNESAALYYQQAWKHSKSALQLLNRAEDLYYETGQSSEQIPSVSSYVSTMDVFKALAMTIEDINEKSKRDDALEVVRALRRRRVDIYSLDNTENVRREGEGYSILPREVNNMKTEEVLEYAANLLSKSEPSYQFEIADSSIGTFHFNQLIFNLAKFPHPFSGPLAQDLLLYMIHMVKRAAPLSQQQRRHQKNKLSPLPRPNIPKPNVKTINAVLKAWAVTTNCQDVARHAEAVLAQLAIYQNSGILWGIHADTVSYNTIIKAWKESKAAGASQRAQEILSLMEDEASNVTPDAISYSATIGCLAHDSLTNSHAEKQAEEILMRMYQRNKDAEGDESVAPRPTTQCFNGMFLAVANGKKKGGGKKALEMLRFMERLNFQYTNLLPDTITFNIVMKALANSGMSSAANRANLLLERMENSYHEGITRLKPDLLSYNTVLDAFSKEGDAKSAERLLSRMITTDDDDIKPDAHSYTTILTAWSRSSDKVKAVRRAEDLFNIEIEGRYANGRSDFRADTSCYNALINVWSKSNERKALYRVTQLLETMEELGFQGGDSEVQPNSRTYTTVLDTLAKSKNYKAYDMSLEILQRMEHFYSEGYPVRPCTRAYTIVLSTIARSRRRDKATKAFELLHKMEREYKAGNLSCRPNVISYNSVLNAAAFSSKDCEQGEQEEAFKVACLTFDELRMSDYLQPSHISYGTFLKAIKNLMPDSDVRDNLVQGLFRKASMEGLVSDFVLKEMRDLATPDLYHSILKGHTNDFGILPKSWSANV